VKPGHVALFVAILGFGVASLAQGEGSCEQVSAACEKAGFVQGGAPKGAGVLIHCLEPLMQGTAQPRGASRPLPRVDPQLIAACTAENPSFGRTRALAAETDAGPAETPAAPPAAAPAAQGRAVATPGRRPNIVFILTDDLAWNLVQYMPHVMAMRKSGITFSNYFVTDSLCCPSRSSIFTGRYPHNTGVFRNTGNDGGYAVFRDRGHERATFATALSAAGYRTAMLGKYLNGYLPAKDPPAPGWTFWAVAGNGYPEFNYNLNENGRIVRYGRAPADYLTDVLSGLATRFIRESRGTPFAIEIATFAPHAPYTPAPRDSDAFPGLHAPRTAAFDAAPEPGAPRWLLEHPALSSADMSRIDADFRKRAQSVLAVDRMVGDLQAAVAATGQAENTYFIFSSDNGYHMGEHRLLPGKMTAFDTDIRVPLVVTGPGVPAGSTSKEVVENVDLCPTFTELGGAAAPASIDGRSLVPLLRGEQVTGWRTLALVEHRGPHTDASDPDAPAARSGNPTTYEAIRGAASVYVEYADGEMEYHDLATDPHELHNAYLALPAEQRRSLHSAVEAMKSCRGAASCAQAEALARR
jgi:arylsulfatase A-like enzyme